MCTASPSRSQQSAAPRLRRPPKTKAAPQYQTLKLRTILGRTKCAILSDDHILDGEAPAEGQRVEIDLVVEVVGITVVEGSPSEIVLPHEVVLLVRHNLFNQYMLYIRKIASIRQLYLQHLVGFAQTALKNDNAKLWVFSEFVRRFQILAILFLYSYFSKLLPGSGQIYEPINSFYAFQLIAKIVLPTIFVVDLIAFDYLPYYLLFTFLQLSFLLLFNLAAIRLERIHFQQLGRANKQLILKMEGNKYQSLNVLNSSYNNGSFVEHFLLKQLMKASYDSWVEKQLAVICYMLNYFTHVLLLPLVYQTLYVILLLSKRDATSSVYYAVAFLNALTILQVILTQLLSLELSQSYRLQDSNYLRLTTSIFFRFSQLFKVVPATILFLSLAFADSQESVRHQVIVFLIDTAVLCQILQEIHDQYTQLPFVLKYKIAVTNFLNSLSLFMAISALIQVPPYSILTILLIATPIGCQAFDILFERRFIHIMRTSLQSETQIQRTKKARSRSSHILSKSFVTQEEYNQIEKNVYSQREERLKMIRHTNYKFFPQFLRLYQLLEIQQQQVMQTNEEFEPQKSRFYIQCIILIRSHINNCVNIYCYCRGLRGEKRTTIERNVVRLPMKIYDDFLCEGIFISVDLIKRYIHSYIKLILNLQTFMPNPDLSLIGQLLVPLCQSEESFQTWLIIMELKMQLKDLNKPYDQISLNLITSYAKYQTLYQAQFNVQNSEVKKTIQYEDYRQTETNRKNLLQKIFQGLIHKKGFMNKLMEAKQTHEMLQELYVDTVQYYDKLHAELLRFYESSQCRTSCLLMLLFYLELRCDYMLFLRFNNILKTKEAKFFEVTTNSNMFHQVCYLKINLSRFSKLKMRGEILARSENAHAFFGYSKEEFTSNITTVHQLVHPLVSHVHNTIIELFLMSNKPNVLRKERCLLARKNHNEMVYVEIFIDLCFQMTDSDFPVYCFLQQVKPIGKFENIRGHFILDDNEMIRGVSQLAFQSFSQDNHWKFIDKDINDFMPKFESYLNVINKNYEQFMNAERMLVKQQSEQNTFSTTTNNCIYNKFLAHFEDEKFILSPTEQYDVDFTMIHNFAIVDGTESKFYLIELNKVSQSDSLTEIKEVSIKESSLIESISEERDNVDLVYNFPQHTDRLPLLRHTEDVQLSTHLINQNNLTTLAGQSLLPPKQRHQTFYFSKGSQKQISDDNEKLLESSYKISSTAVKSKDEYQKLLNKASQYHEFTNKQLNISPLFLLEGINLLILVIIFTFMITYQVRFKDEIEKIIPTIQILQAFITTDYTDNIQLAITYHKQTTTEGVPDASIDQVYRLLKKDALNYVNYQKSYFLNPQIRAVFTDTIIPLKNNESTVALNAAFEILYYQQMYLNIENRSDHFLNMSFATLLYQFPYHKQAYENINTEFNTIVQDSILAFTASQDLTLYMFCLIVALISAFSYLIYHNFFVLLKKYSRCTEQIRYDAISNEIQSCEQLLMSKKFSLYEARIEINGLNKKFQRKRSEAPSTPLLHSIRRHQLNPQKQIKINDVFSVKRHLYFLIPIFSLLLCLLFLIITFKNVDSLMKQLQEDITFYNQGILFQQSFSLVCFSGIILENSNYLVEKKYLNASDLPLYYQFAAQAIENVKFLGKEIRLPYSEQSSKIIGVLSQDICVIFSDPEDISECDRIYDGMLHQGILKSSQQYINLFTNNYAVNYSNNYIVKTQADDLISINFIIKGITNFVVKSRESLENYINSQISTKLFAFIIAFLLCLILQILAMLEVSIKFRCYLRTLRQMIYFLPKDTLYLEDSLLKTLIYVQRTQNDCVQ